MKKKAGVNQLSDLPGAAHRAAILRVGQKAAPWSEGPLVCVTAKSFQPIRSVYGQPIRATPSGPALVEAGKRIHSRGLKVGVLEFLMGAPTPAAVPVRLPRLQI
jgi:hypothetical protein